MARAWEIVASPMSINLPRSDRPLHFTGSVRALGPERPANALGQARPVRVEPPPQPARPARSQDVYVIDAQPTPYFASRPSERAEKVAKPVKLMTARGQLASMDEDLVTASIDQDQIDAALFPIAKRPNASAPAPNLPIPLFRTAAEAQQHHAQPTVIVRPPKGGSLPLGVWLAIALIAAVVSYNLAPQAAESAAAAVRALDSR